MLFRSQTDWHYIDCDNGNVITYAHGITAVSGAYDGGTFAPSIGKIYMAPYVQATDATWHYFDVRSQGTIALTNFSTTLSKELRLTDGNGGQYYAIRTPDVISTNYTLTLPTDDGSKINSYKQMVLEH